MYFADFSIDAQWDGGFVGYITFENFTANSLDGWRAEFLSPFEIEEIWGASIVSQEGDRYVVENAVWNQQVAQGDRASFGFVAKLENASPQDSRYQPRQFQLNGLTPDDMASPLTSDDGPRFQYGEALQKSFLFYEAQRAGDLPDDNRIDWRGDSVLNDGADVGLDLSGGYFDAGDTVKFGMPMTASMTLLSWGVDEYRQGYQRSGQLDEALDAIKWGTDYLLNAHVSENGQTKAFYGQVGLGDVDHATRGRIEDMNVPRPAFKIDAQNPGTDLAAEAAAALAAAAVVFQPTDPQYASRLIANAEQLYAFAQTYQDRYSNSIADTQKFYRSDDGFEDELAWGATWLYKATGNQAYLNTAEANYDGLGWTQSWGDKNFGTSVLLAQEKPNNVRYQQDAEQWLNNWTGGGGGVQYTPGGLAWITEWGSARMAATASFIAGVYSDTVTDPGGKYAQFAERQVDYLLGDNPNNFSYMVGFGDNYPKQPHHRNAVGTDYFETPADNAHILFGALVGGPKSPDDSDYQDVRSDYIANEVALDYNAGFTGCDRENVRDFWWRGAL